MLDIQFIRENTKAVKKAAEDKGANVDIDELLKLDEQRRAQRQEIEKLRRQRNQIAESAKGKKPSPADVKKGKQLKADLEKLDTKLNKVEQDFYDLLKSVPNVFAEDTPVGGEEANKVEKETKKPELDFEPKDHLTMGEAKGWIDFERGAKVSGSKFYYLKGAAVKLEMAVMNWLMDKLAKEGFEFLSTPHLVSKRVAEGAGFSPRGEEEQHEYRVEGEDLTLIATAEVPLTGFHADEILEDDELPKLYAALTPSYRREAGAYGKPSRGLFRVHQFNKLEMYVFCRPEQSEKWHQKLLGLEEEIYTELKIPYRVVRIAAGDLGAPAYKKYDLEYWSPVEKKYRELTSCSNCTDYQARNLNIRMRTGEGDTQFVHTLNGTASAFSRTLIAILENHQQSDGTVALPPVLHKYFGKGGL